jgi:beta-lactamase superfamily II metal-dependent hydrolase
MFLHRTASVAIVLGLSGLILARPDVRAQDSSTETIITTVAEGSLGDGGPATDARLDSPTGVAVDTSGNLYIANELNHRIRRVTLSQATTDAGTVLISPIYGGGGNVNAILTNDFVELLNASGSTVSLDGWTVQYASASGSSWQSINLSGSLTPGQYYLVQGGTGQSGGSTSLPTPDAISKVGLSAINGKIALVNTSTPLSGSCPVDGSSVVDFVGYGTANCSEGSPATNLTNTTALLRADGGCTDTANNASNFTETAPSPRNSSDSRSACIALETSTDPTATGLATPSQIEAGATVLFTVTVTPGSNPASSSIGVTADLSPIDGSATQVFSDDGTNGDLTSGDNIFSFQVTVPASTTAATVAMTATITDSQSRTTTTVISLTVATPTGTKSFSLTDRGGTSITSRGTASAVTLGYGRVRPDGGMTTPSGLAIFGFTQDGVLISEAGVPAVATVQEGRIFAEVNGPVNTGLAIANPNDTAATVTFFFTDTNGVDFGSDSFELGANQQTAKFLDQDPFNGGSAVLGTFTFTSSVPIAVVALRGFTNKRSEFLMTTLPVSPVSSTSTDTIYFSHFADGGGWTTQVVLVNPTETPMTGTVQFFGQGSGTTAASPVALTLDDASIGPSFAYSISARSSQRFTTSNPAGTVSVGSVRANPNGGSNTPSGLVIFSFISGGVTVSEAGVPALPEGSAFRVYVESSGAPEQIGSVRSGVAITDTSGAFNTVTLELANLDGSLALAAEELSIPPSGQVSRFLDELFSVPDNFSGVLRVTSTADVAVVGLRLRINTASDIKMTTTPPSNEVSATTTADTYFPHIVDSGDWSTQFILYSGTAGQTSSGSLSFIDQAGQALNLAVSSSTVEFQVHFLDVGTGDSAIIDVGETEIIIDGGNSTRVLHDYAENTGIIDGPIELVVVTHGDSDHWKGLTRLLGFDGQATSPRTALEFWEPGYNRDCNPLTSYDEFIADVQGMSGITVRRPLEDTYSPSTASSVVSPFSISTVPDVTLSVLHSASAPEASNGDCSYRANNASIVIMVEIAGFRFLFTGDANGKERDEASPGTPGHVEAQLLTLPTGTLTANVVKVPHHGSETASTQSFIEAVSPSIVVISASTLHDLPKDTVVQRYDNGTRTILRTDRDASSDNDHIVCRPRGRSLDCVYSN